MLPLIYPVSACLLVWVQAGYYAFARRLMMQCPFDRSLPILHAHASALGLIVHAYSNPALTIMVVCRAQWEKIGAVVGGPSDDTVATGTKYFEGQQYDFVFDVDVTEGAPPLKLPVNRDDNPYIVADK